MTETVHLTKSAAARFPDLVGLSGTVVITEHTARHTTGWTLVAWDGGITTWIPADDLTAAPEASDGGDDVLA